MNNKYEQVAPPGSKYAEPKGDKYEAVAEEVYFRTDHGDSKEQFVSVVSAYLRSQFPEPKPVEGVYIIDDAQDYFMEPFSDGSKHNEINGLKKLVSSLFDYKTGGNLFSEAEALITAFIEAREVGKWIPVTEELPGNNRNALCVCRGGSRIIAWYDEMNKEWFDEGELLRDVTHWQPLPAAPKDGE